MNDRTDARLAALEQRVEWLIARLQWVEEQVGTKQRREPFEPLFEPMPPPPPPRRREEAPPAPTRPPLTPRPETPRAEEGEPRKPEREPAPAAGVPPPRPERMVPALDFEEIFGGRVLAWLGGVAVLLGVVFFLVMAVSRGWIDEPTRVTLAFLGSTALLGTGLYLYERRGRAPAALAMVATAIAALYAADTAATALYDLASPPLGLAIAGLVGAAATAIAVRWSAVVVGWLGIVGALLAPVLVDAGTSFVALAFMGLALVAATGVLVWQRWDWLATAVFVVSVLQLLAWLDTNHAERLVLSLVVLAAFWAVFVVAAIGYELRVPTEDLRVSSAMLLLANAVLGSGMGWFVLDDTGHGTASTAWVIGAAVLHIALGTATLRGRISREIALLSLAIAIGLSAIAAALALDGPALVAAWAVEAVILVWLAGRMDSGRAYVGSIVLLGLAAGHALLFDAPPELLIEEGTDATATVAVALLAIAGGLCAYLYRGPWAEARLAYAAVAGAALAYLPPIALDGVWVVAAWAALAVAVAAAAYAGGLEAAAPASFLFLALSAMHVLAFEAPPIALREGVDDLAAAAVAIALVGAAAFALLRVAEWRDELRLPLGIIGAVAVVYLPSVAIVDLTAAGDDDPGQTPQVLLSAFWSVTGLASLVYGLVRDDRRLRLGGLVLLALAIVKVFLYDLSELDEIYRVLSFIVLGLLLLTGAFAYQRIRRSANEEATE